MLLLAIFACKRDEPALAASTVPLEDRSRYAGCVSELRTDHELHTSLATSEFDGLGWEVEHRSDDDADGDDDRIERYEGRNAYGLYTAWTYEYVGVGVESVTATYIGAFWTSRELWFGDRLDERWTYSQPSERELAAEVDLDGDEVVERSWRRTLNDQGRPESESLTEVDGAPVSDETWTWDDERLVEDVFHDLSGGWSASYAWGDALGPDHVTQTDFDERGAVAILLEGSFEYDDEGRQRSATWTVDYEGDGVVDDNVASAWTWTCP